MPASDPRVGCDPSQWIRNPHAEGAAQLVRRIEQLRVWYRGLRAAVVGAAPLAPSGWRGIGARAFARRSWLYGLAVPQLDRRSMMLMSGLGLLAATIPLPSAEATSPLPDEPPSTYSRTTSTGRRGQPPTRRIGPCRTGRMTCGHRWRVNTVMIGETSSSTEIRISCSWLLERTISTSAARCGGTGGSPWATPGKRGPSSTA